MKLKKIKSFIITVDGKGGSGKSTAAKLLSKRLGIPHLSSGRLYRWSAKKLLEDKPKDKILYLRKRLPKLNYNSLQKINLHTPEISKYSAIIARILAVRKEMKKTQKSWVQRNKNRCIVEGRDSHVIFPNAFVKFYLKTNLNTAALRRFKELRKKKRKTTLKMVKTDLKQRDYHDTTRRFGRLKLSKDHVLVRTNILNRKEMVAKMAKEIDKKLRLIWKKL